VIDNNDDPLVSAVDDNADRLRVMVDLLRSMGLEAGALHPAAPVATSRAADRRLIWLRIAIASAPSIAALLARLGAMRSRYGSPWAHVLFLASIAGLAASFRPEAMPGVVSVWQAVFTNRTHVIVGSSISVIVPLLLLYAGLDYSISLEKPVLQPSLPPN
jgi:cytochrome bd-type quinol oxidase subunit 2